jgi:hypothetical protein
MRKNKDGKTKAQGQKENKEEGNNYNTNLYPFPFLRVLRGLCV